MSTMRVIFSSFFDPPKTYPIKELFRQIDLDNDGFVSKEDVKAFLLKFDIKITKYNIDILADVRRLDLVDIQTYFLKLGIPIELAEAKRLLKRMNKTDAQEIEYSEWRKFLLFQPICDLESIAHYWRNGCVIDLSSDPVITIPQILKKDNDHSRDVIQLVAGGVAGVVSRTCTAPIDRLKIMRQVYGYKHKRSGFLEAYRYMLREGGIVSLWRGNFVNVVKIAPETAIKYTTYERYKRLLMENDSLGFFEGHSAMTKFSAGAMAGLTAQSVIYPMEVLRTRMCLRKTGQYSSILDCGRKIYHELGVVGFYRGYFVNVAGILPYAGIELATYEWLKSIYIYRYMRHILHLSPRVISDHPAISYVHPPAHTIPFLAASASMLAVVLTYPMALIRSKMQASFYWKHPLCVGGNPHPKLTLPSLLSAIWRDDGVIGLYRGMGANLIKVLPATAISMLTYESIRRKCNIGPMGSG
ncbi:unnamed protein product [Schistocephalus solidus]|uniref:EF-hand domain-containing protein n=1 Tax=Schistocephalus solidus TaxID=70667 RepID=A0A183SKZ7_SCHSO|nr:unnamed protein product [Schistocephalus solidus]